MTGEAWSRRRILKTAAAAAMVGFPAARGDAAQPVDVLILGAGMAGLHAARMLEKLGVSVAVLEGSPRVGGRCWTKYDVPGCPELGAQQVGFSYGRVRGNAAELGVALIDPPTGATAETRPGQLAISIGGARPTDAPWPTSPMNHLAEDEKALQPLQLLSHYLLKNDPLVDLDDWQQPQFAEIDKMSLRQYLTRQGASPEALRLMDISISADNLDDGNALDFLRKTHYYFWEAKKGPYHVVKGGTSALTDAMAASLKIPVALNKIVAHIDTGPEQVTIRCTDGSHYSARACICTIPTSVLKDIPVTGAVTAAQRQAWAQQRYSKLLQIFMRYRSAYWEKDGLPATTWTDGPFELIMHTPSTLDPKGVLMSYINGSATAPLDHLGNRELSEKLIAELVRLRPAAAGEVEVAYIHDWNLYPFAKGHVAYFAPGDIARFGDIAGQNIGALHFAGEHLCRIHAGIEGACETAENAVIQVMGTIGRG